MLGGARLFVPALALLVAARPAPAEENPVAQTELMKVMAAIDAAPALAARYKTCPADIRNQNASLWRWFADSPELEMPACAEDTQQCATACFESRNENACFSLARVLQENLDEDKSRYWETMFAQACATGSAGGCTNRGGGIRNGGYSDDPLSDLDEPAKNACLFRTFEASCGDEDAWGCFMFGQAYHYGEGAQPDKERAIRAYRKSCDIDPDFVACDYAKSNLNELDAAVAD